MAEPATSAQIDTGKKAWLYMKRALAWRCPVCGQSPMFRPVRELRSLSDWFEPLSGCPHCAYTFEREPGYFMLALWSFAYGPAALVGIGCLLFFYAFFELPTWQLLLLVLLPTLFVALLIVRHAKAFYLALDQYFFYQRDEH